MIGKQQISIDATQFAAGLATSDYTGDGGMGTSSIGINPVSTPGVLSPTVYVSINTNISGNIVATAEDSQAVLPVNRVMIDDAGNVYSAAIGSTTKQITGGVKTYSFGVTDMAAFAGYNYVSSTGFLAQINTATWTWTEAYKTYADSSAFHPLLTYAGLLFQGDGNLLLQMTEAGVVTTQLTLTTNEKIVSLGVDPGTGLMLIGVQTSYNPTDSVQKRGIVYMHDGVSALYRRKILIEDLPCAFFPMNGVVYMGVGMNVGYWNGSGFVFMRKLNNATFLKNDLPYKHHFAHVGNILLIANGLDILGYGDILNGKRVWFPFFKQNVNANKLLAVFPTGTNRVCAAFSASQLLQINLAATTGTSASSVFYTNNINFPRPVFIRRMRLIFTGIAANGLGATVGIIDEKGVSNVTAASNLNVTSGTKYVFDFDYTSLKLQTAQPFITLDATVTMGLVRVILYYDVAE